MKFLVDAQLPRRLVGILAEAGHEAVHTFWLPDQNRTKDGTVRRLADAEGRIVMTKDSDFVTSHLLLASPAKLLRVSTGNMPTQPLIALVQGNLSRIEHAFSVASFVELTATALIVHG